LLNFVHVGGCVGFVVGVGLQERGSEENDVGFLGSVFEDETELIFGFFFSSSFMLFFNLFFQFLLFKFYYFK